MPLPTTGLQITSNLMEIVKKYLYIFWKVMTVLLVITVVVESVMLYRAGAKTEEFKKKIDDLNAQIATNDYTIFTNTIVRDRLVYIERTNFLVIELKMGEYKNAQSNYLSFGTNWRGAWDHYNRATNKP